MRSTPLLEKQLQEFCSKGLLKSRTENNQYLKVSYKGSGTLVSPKWNIKIFHSGSVVCTDMITLQDLISGKLKPGSTLKVIQIDDAGIGFPMLGIMVGVTDGVKVWTDVVPVEFFQSPLYDTKEHLKEYTRRGLAIVDSLGISPETHRIEICSGHINRTLKDALRRLKFDVRVVEIKGLLQGQLEDMFREYVKNTLGEDLAYDPKEIEKCRLGMTYYKVLNWGRANAPHLLKSGWKAIGG